MSGLYQLANRPAICLKPNQSALPLPDDLNRY